MSLILNQEVVCWVYLSEVCSPEPGNNQHDSSWSSRFLPAGCSFDAGVSRFWRDIWIKGLCGALLTLLDPLCPRKTSPFTHSTSILHVQNSSLSKYNQSIHLPRPSITFYLFLLSQYEQSSCPLCPSIASPCISSPSITSDLEVIRLFEERVKC